MFPLPAMLAFAAGQTPFQFDVLPDHGLKILVGGVPVVQGSYVQYFEADWSKSYFNSANSLETIKKLDNGDTVLMFKSTDGKAYGNELFSPITDGLKVTYTFGWTGDKPVNVELAAGTLWADPLLQGSLSVDGKPARALTVVNYADDQVATRAYGANAREFKFQAPLGKLTFRGDTSSWTCFDARGLNKTWALGKNYFWLGQSALTIKPNDVATTTAEWHFDPAPQAPVQGGSVALDASPLETALTPSVNDFKILPTPRSILVKPDLPLVLGSTIEVDPPSIMPDIGSQIVTALQAHWDVPNLKAVQSPSANFIIRIQDENLPPGGYELRITRQNVLIMGQDEEGVRNAIATLGQLAFAKDGKLCLASGIVRDWPAALWRGVHLFVGPDALKFHRKLWDRVLSPLKFNKVVVECERTKWRALPTPKPEDYMSREDLLNLFDYYRDIGVEPIPLIESLGHMGWLLSDKGASNLCLYPDVTTCIDPRLPASAQLLSSIWDEAIHLLHPKDIHFGLDEIDQKWPAKNANLTTTLWQVQLPFLADIAAKHNCRMMCWGDQCLAAGDAPDAALADSEADAVARRSFIPKDALVTDWHYVDDPNPDRFMHTLDVWKQDGVEAIAATWFRPENIRGFYLAAIQEGAGTLQTTWAGYQSNEANMVREFRQFAAMVVAADYAWSGRKDDWDKLGYDPYDVFSRMYFGGQSELVPTAGASATLGTGTETRIGNVDFKLFTPYSLRSTLTSQTSQLPEDLVVQTSGLKGRCLCLALDTSTPIDDNQPVADVEIDTTDGKKILRSLLYGADVRAAGDLKATVIGARAGGLSVVTIDMGIDPVTVQKIFIHATSSYAGLRLHGVTAY